MSKGGGSDTQTQTTTQQSPWETMPDWAKEGMESEFDQSREYGNRARELYQKGYGGVAGMSNLERQAMEQIGGLPGYYQPLENEAARMAGSGYEAYDQAYQSAQPYQQMANQYTGAAGELMLDPEKMRAGFEDPYLEAITDQITREADRNRLFDEGRSAAIGGLTGSRAAVADMLREEMTSRERGAAASDAFRFATDAGMNRAQGLAGLGGQYHGFGQDVFGRGMDVGQGRANLAGTYENLASGRYNRGTGYSGALGAMGEKEREQRQREMDEEWRRLQQYGSAAGFPRSATDYAGTTAGGGTSTSTSEIPKQGTSWTDIAGLGIAAAGVFSDARLKTDVEPVGETNGLLVYKFRYIPDLVEDYPELDGEHVGPMAQDVAEMYPDAVGAGRWRGEDYLTIDFGAAA